MTQKKITSNGKEYPIVFTMDTLMNFETIVGKSFFETDFKTLKDRMALVIAAVITAKEDTDLTIEDIIGDKGFDALQQIINTYLVISELLVEFTKVPAVVSNSEKEEQQQTGEEEQKETGEKNA
jgi:hypothetical protein